ncbi:hypothetical protein M1437_01840, partial [Patescibacteria group bacterium]|nr:hypothetical protein [Patescibacteria group bacterium]
MAERINDLRTIVIPREHTQFPQDLRVNVIPITDQWLISPERTWNEVDRVLEGRLQGIQSQFLFEDGKPTPMTKKYGLERSPSGNAIRFLTYVELLDEYTQGHEFFLSKAKDAREVYENEKERIKKSGIKQSKAQRFVQNLWVSKYNPQILKNNKQAEELERVKDLILRKAVLDIFSVQNNATETGNPLIADAFPRMVEEVKVSFDENRNPLNEEFKQRKPIEQFINSLATYLSKTSDGGLFARYEYRKSPNMILKIEDCKVLDACLEQALDVANLISSPATETLLSHLSKAYFTFLRRRLLQKTSLGSDSYPYASLLYDLFTTVIYRGRPVMLSNISDFVDAHFADLMHSIPARNEFTAIGSERIPATVTMYNTLGQRPDLLRLDPLNLETVSKLPESVIQFHTEDACRLYNGLWRVANMYRYEGKERIKHSQAIAAAVDYIDATYSPDKIYLTDERYEHVRSFLGLLPLPSILRQKGIEIDLLMLLPGEIRRRKLKEPSIAGMIADYQRLISGPLATDTLAATELLTRQYLINLPEFMKEIPNPERIDRENGFLWNETLDKPLWFVSPRGDRYSKKRDHQLEGLGIESITFNIDRAYPREHRVVVRLVGLDMPLEYWLDTNRKFLSVAHLAMPVDPTSQNRFVNLLLKRLYLITSGLLAKEQERKGAEAGTRVIEYKRAHYRKLQSTSLRPITMESHEALMHAKEVKEDYGIDIFAEIKRRRALGTLKPNEYLTFVRETQPRIVA